MRHIASIACEPGKGPEDLEDVVMEYLCGLTDRTSPFYWLDIAVNRYGLMDDLCPACCANPKVSLRLLAETL